MIRTLVALFLLGHGFVHAAVWAAPKQQETGAPFDPGHSWLLSAVHVGADPARTAALGLAWVSTAMYALAAASLVAGVGLWGPVAVAAAVASVLFKTAFFNAWLTVGVLLDVAVIAAVAAGWPPSLF